MTKEEIKASIAVNIAGQFNQVDISGKLAGILEAIVDSVPEPEGPKVLDAEDFIDDKLEIAEIQFDEYLQNIHYIKLENPVETNGYLSEHTPLEDISNIVNRISEVIETGQIMKIYCSEYYSIENEEVSYADYIALVMGTDGKFWLVYKYIER